MNQLQLLQQGAAHLQAGRMEQAGRSFREVLRSDSALWAWLPLITCPGRSFASRVAASLLRAASLPELITASLEDYEVLAVTLARDPARLESFSVAELRP